MALRHNFSTQVSNLAALKRAAHRLGYVQTRGPQRGQGSIRALLEAIANGEITLVSNKSEQVTENAADQALRRIALRGIVTLPARAGQPRPYRPAKIKGEPASIMLIRERR